MRASSRRPWQRCLAAAALLSLTACVSQTGGVAASTRPLDQNGFEQLGDVTGTSSRVALLGILPITGGNSTEAALNDAKAQIPGTDALIEVTADTHGEFWILWSTITTTVRGTAVKVK